MVKLEDLKQLREVFKSFDLDENGKSYQLTYKTEWLDEAKVQIGSDLWALQENMASVSRLDFAEASGKRYLEP